MTGELDAFAAELLAAAPVLADVLEADGEGLTPDPEMPTVWFGGAGRAVGERLGELEEHERHTIFAVVERHLAEGSELLGTCVTTGLLESLAHSVSAGRVSGPALAALLGPESRAYVDAYDGFTLGRSGLDGSATDEAPPRAPSRSRRRWRRR